MLLPTYNRKENMPRASCSGRRVAQCHGSCVRDARGHCRRRCPCSEAPLNTCQNGTVPNCEWRTWNRRARHYGCYPTRGGPPITVFTVAPNYRCHVHPIRCGVRGCKVWTLIRPVCAAHARTGLGFEVRRSGANGCGLFATREFKKGDLICPYLGAVRPWSDWRCPHSTGNAPESGYSFDITSPHSADGGYTFDASCERSYGGMANHATESHSNSKCVKLTGFHRNNLGANVGAGRVAVTGFHIHSAPALLRTCPNAFQSAGPMHESVWLQAKHRIPVGMEIFINYGSSARVINAIVHQTIPPLA